jgi:phosphatidylglycerophosphate synthase
MPTVSPNPTVDPARRPLKSRQTRWAAAMAAWLARRNVSPNAISLASIAFAAVAAAAYVGCIFVPSPALAATLLVIACVGIQLRLLCNLLDGMVAVEGGKASKAGEIYNDAPDRVADVMILVAAGYAAGGADGPVLGWLAAVVALLTAYVRVLGRSLGAGVYFIGPMAKPHRMAMLTAANLLGALLTPWAWQRWPLRAALALIIIGGILTAIRRLRRIARDLRTGP